MAPVMGLPGLVAAAADQLPRRIPLTHIRREILTRRPRRLRLGRQRIP